MINPSFYDITVVAIHGGGGIEKMIPSLIKTSKSLPGCKTLLITDKKIDSEIEQKIVSPFDYHGYSHFVVYCLHQYIETDYVLICQDDGWALNPNNWRNNWFQYDYIGAFTHSALIENYFLVNYAWVHKRDQNPFVVQNGGFSFRSKKFLEAPSKYGIVIKQQPIIQLNNEDVQLCCLMRPELEKVGMKFAPEEEAKYFAFEHLSPIVHNGMDITQIFGHHSNYRKLISDNEMLWTMSEEEFKISDLEDKVLELFQYYGYSIHKTKQ